MAEKQLDAIEVVGGHPAVDFVNTVHSWRSDPPPDYLHGFDDLLEWHVRTGLVDRKAAVLFRTASRREKQRAFREALALRAALHELFAAVAADQALPRDALENLDDVIRRTARWRRLAVDAAAAHGRVRAVWDFADAPAAAITGPVAWLAADLLENGPLDRLKECPGERCGWLFLDTSRNRSRTWCSMKTCGNTAKVKRFRERTSG